MKYLVIAVKRNGYYNATLFEEEKLGTQCFDIIELSLPQTISDITLDNYEVIEEGKILGNIRDIEPVMRKIGFRKCDICGDWVTPQDIRNEASIYRNGKRYCRHCWNNNLLNNPELPLEGYHDTSYDVKVINGAGEHYTIRNVLGIGFEAEYYHGSTHDSYMKCTKTFHDMAKPDSLNRMFRCEQDCTVSGEIISNIFTKKSLYDFDFSIITDILKLNGNIEGNTQAGLHVHLSKLWLGESAHEQCLNYLKLQYFMKSYENDFLKLCGRNPEYMGYCKFFSQSEIENMKQNILSHEDPWDYMPCSHGGGRGCALNASGATIEFRIGANTNDPVRMRNYILFLLGITENIKNVPFEKCYCIGKVTRLVPNEVMNYWRKQGCFLNTNAIDTRGVTLIA